MKTRNFCYYLFLPFIILIFSHDIVHCQEDSSDIKFLMSLDLESLMQVKVVSASRHNQKIIDSPRSISVIKSEELRNKNYRTTPEALAEFVGVHLQETNYGGGSPIIRGLIGNQILILVDGVRINNGITRLGPNQYLNTIDINSIEQIEVVRGAGSVLYGSDALGGLINIITKSNVKLLNGKNGIANVSGRYSTADNGVIGRIELGSKFENLNLFGGVSVKKFNNLKGGKNTGKQNFTGYDEWNGDLKFGYTLNNQHSVVIGYQHVYMGSVPRSDRLLAGYDLKREWDPELRNLVYLDYKIKSLTRFIDNINLKVSYQSQSEEIHRITSTSPNTERTYIDEVNTIGTTLQLTSSIDSTHLFTYGFDMTLDKIYSSRNDFNLTTGAWKPNTTNYADGSNSNIFALFAQDEIKISEKWSAYLGLRYSSISVKADLNDPKVGLVKVDISPNSLVSSGFLMYKLKPGLTISLGVSQGFRAPNIDDATKLGQVSNVFNYPNPNLEPEKSINYELALKISKINYSSSFSIFLSEIKDLIVYVPSTLYGKSFLDENENGIKDEGEIDIVTRDNIGKSQIYGFEWEGRYMLTKEFKLKGNIAWVYGKDKMTGDPLTRIPPLEGLFSIRWKPQYNFWLEYYNIFATKQNRLSPGDISDIRIPDGGTPGFITFNARGGYDTGRYGKITLGVENITNTTYRYHASGIDMSGTNVVLGYEYGL